MKHFVLAALLFAGSLSFAQEEETVVDPMQMRVQKLELMMEQLQNEKAQPAPVITAPVTVLKPTFEILRDTDQLRSQLGPAASKIYFHPEAQWQLGLSSELFTFRAADENRANVLSVAPVIAFRPHRRLIFNAQFLFENGGSESRNTVAYQKGQSIVQMAYLDWLVNDKADSGVRVGHQLIPIGWTNTRNEPVTFLSVGRPELEREIIPSNWHENGVSLWLDRPRADIQIGVFNSLDARGFRGESFLSGGRQQGQNAKTGDVMGVFRINAKNEWFLAGASFASGNSAQSDPALRNSAFRLGEIHARLRFARLEFMGMLVEGQLDDSESVSIYNGTAMGASASGNSIQASYNVLKSAQSLWVFARHSNYNLQSEPAPGGFLADPANDKQATVFGASYFPIPNVVVKSDLSLLKNAAGKDDHEIAVGVGVVF